MDVSFTNVLEGARQYFQGLPAAQQQAAAVVAPYYHQNSQQQDQQTANQHQTNRQTQQVPYQQQCNDYADNTNVDTSSSWLQQPSTSEPNRTPNRESTSAQRSSSFSSIGSRAPSHPAQYQDVSLQYHNPYPRTIQNSSPTSRSTTAPYQFSRPQSREIPNNHQYQNQAQGITTSTYHQPSSPQVLRPVSREQNMINAYSQSSSSAIHTSLPTSQNTQYAYPSRSYYVSTQSQMVASKPSVSYTMSQPSSVSSQQQSYYKQTTTYMVSNPTKPPNQYSADSRSSAPNTHSNGQYQNVVSSDQTVRATHNLPPIAALSNYRASKPNKDVAKTITSSRMRPSSYTSTMTQPMGTSQQAPRENRVDQYPYNCNDMSSYNSYNVMPNQNSTRISQPQVSTVITQAYSNIAMTTTNTSHYNTATKSNFNSINYQRSTENQNVPQMLPNQNNNNYVEPKPIDRPNIIFKNNPSVIKQRKESPLDLSVKTVRTSADSTETDFNRTVYGQNKVPKIPASHSYPTLDINNTIEKSLSQSSQATPPSIPKVEFQPNFSRHSNWNPKSSGEIPASRYQESMHGNPNYNNNSAYLSDQKTRYPPGSFTSVPQYPSRNEYNGNTPNVYPHGRDQSAKRHGQVETSTVPSKIAKIENWRESINSQIEEKFTSHYKQLQAQQQHIHSPRMTVMNHANKVIQEPTISRLANGDHSQTHPDNQYGYQKQLYAPLPQTQHAYTKPNISYSQSKHSQSAFVPSVNSQYPGYYHSATKQAPHIYMNPSTRPVQSSSKTSLSTGADKRVISLLRNTIEIKEQKKIEQLKSQDSTINLIQHPNTDVTAPLQPKPGIDRNNVSPFTSISVPDPNICRMPSKMVRSIDESHIHDIMHRRTEDTVIMNNSSNTDYDGLAAFLAARIRTKGELKEVGHQNSTAIAARDARIQAFLEDTIKSPNRPSMLMSGTSSLPGCSPPKLLKEKQSGSLAPRKRLFSRNDEDIKPDMPRREKSTMRSSSETSVFDFPDSEDENEMPVLERQTLDAMRKDRRNSLKQSTTPLLGVDIDIKTEPIDQILLSPEDEIFGSICDKFMDQLKKKPVRRIKRIPDPVSKPEATTPVKIKIEIVDDDDNIEYSHDPDVVAQAKLKAKEAERQSPIMKTPVIGNVIRSDSDMSDSEVKLENQIVARNRQRVRRKIISSSESSGDESNKPTIIKIEKTEEIAESKEKSVDVEDSKEKKLIVEVKSEEASKVDTQKGGSESSESTPSKTADHLAIVRPAKKPSFGDGSDFYPGWEEGMYRYKKSLRMPPSLIQLTRPPMRLSTSLPDLDPYPQSPTTSIFTDVDMKDSSIDNKKCIRKIKFEPIDSDNESSSSFNIFSKKTNYDSEGSSSIKSLPNTKKENLSILDKLLEKCGGRQKRKLKRKDDHFSKIIEKHDHSNELLPTPTPSLALESKSPEKSKGLTAPVINASSAVLPFRKDTVNHFKDTFINSGPNILAVHDKFTTIVMSSRTRKETRAMKQRATIKEVFGEDRPASAPPCSGVNELEEKKVELEPFSKNLEDILIKKEKLDDLKPDKPEPVSSAKIKVKQEDKPCLTIKKEVLEDDDDTNDDTKLSDLVVKKDPDAISETMSLDGEETTTVKRKIGKIRRKFSSGFDYLRKKKKIKKEDTDVANLEKKKRKVIPARTPESIDDVQKEVKSWVLNKGIGESHLHRAARLGFADVTAFCLEKMDCPPSPRDNAGYTPLHVACARGHLEIARLLLRYGANVHESAKGGVRPLHEAIEKGDVEIVRLLLSYGADPNLATYSGVTPLDLASDENTKKFLQEHLADKEGEGGPSWPFCGPSSCFDPEGTGYNVLTDAPAADPDSELQDIEIEVSDAILPNLYTLAGEPSTDRWVLLQDLSHFLRIKSRDALIKQISTPELKANVKSGLREFKMSDFLEQARCCQFSNMGEKVNIRTTKISLVKYTDKVKELLGVETVIVTGR